MEIPQSRTFESKGRKISKHEFLSACSNSNVQTDPIPTSQGGYLKTQDFLQPLERVGTRAYVNNSTTTTSSELTSPHVQNQHVLPGGIGTYTISQIPYMYHHQRVTKPEVSPMFTVVEENSNSNCSSYAANNGFTLWDESTEKKEKTRKENAAATMEQRSSFSSRSPSQTSGLKSQSFMEMLRSVKGSSQEDDDDEEFVTKKKNNTCPRVKVDEKGHDNEQKPNTPRSKHSATEQRRRSKINDRFQTLRQLIPNSDQKRDKASFLLEVIEYIHFLQETVNKHEVIPHQGKLMNWPTEATVPVLADAQDQECLNRAIETTPVSVSSGRKRFFSPASQSCPAPCDAAMETDEKLREEEAEEEEEEFSVLKGTIGISSVYSQGLLKTLTETLQTSGVDLSKARISVQIKLSKQPQKDVDS